MTLTQASNANNEARKRTSAPDAMVENRDPSPTAVAKQGSTSSKQRMALHGSVAYSDVSRQTSVDTSSSVRSRPTNCERGTQSNTTAITSHEPSPDQDGLKRRYDTISGASSSGAFIAEATPSEPRNKRVRRCCKCGSGECKGKGGWTFCMNSCRDCGKLACKGRNSRRPGKRCSQAWI
jgi:hypothetical protein